MRGRDKRGTGTGTGTEGVGQRERDRFTPSSLAGGGGTALQLRVTSFTASPHPAGELHRRGDCTLASYTGSQQPAGERHRGGGLRAGELHRISAPRRRASPREGLRAGELHRFSARCFSVCSDAARARHSPQARRLQAAPAGLPPQPVPARRSRRRGRRGCSAGARMVLVEEVSVGGDDPARDSDRVGGLDLDPRTAHWEASPCP